jgi:hypothetical protein
MDLANMRRQGARHLIAYCLKNACRGSALIDVSGYPDVIEVLEFGKRAKCAKCGGNRVDVRRNSNGRPRRDYLTRDFTYNQMKTKQTQTTASRTI